jgi:hypothetical protein
MRVPFGSLMRSKADSGQPERAFRKRQHTRVPFSGPASLFWIAPDGLPKKARGHLVNASEGGMAVTLKRPLAVGTRVWILLEDGADGRGEIGYCDRVQQGYQIGLRFIAEERAPELGPDGGENLVEWIGECGRLLGCPASIRNASEGEIEVVVRRVVPCPAIVLLSGQLRCLCCTRDCRVDGGSYCFQAQVLSEAFPDDTTS